MARWKHHFGGNKGQRSRSRGNVTVRHQILFFCRLRSHSHDGQTVLHADPAIRRRSVDQTTRSCWMTFRHHRRAALIQRRASLVHPAIVTPTTTSKVAGQQRCHFVLSVGLCRNIPGTGDTGPVQLTSVGYPFTVFISFTS